MKRCIIYIMLNKTFKDEISLNNTLTSITLQN
jgi:hypothetical protein